jgi:hypothetical protein
VLKEMVVVVRMKREDRRWSGVRVTKYCFLLSIGTMVRLFVHLLWRVFSTYQYDLISDLSPIQPSLLCQRSVSTYSGIVRR